MFRTDPSRIVGKGSWNEYHMHEDPFFPHQRPNLDDRTYSEIASGPTDAWVHDWMVWRAVKSPGDGGEWLLRPVVEIANPRQIKGAL